MPRDRYVQPLPQGTGPPPEGALPLAAGALWFDRVLIRRRGAAAELVPADALEPAEREGLTAPREPLPGCDGPGPAIMGIVNVTPDSFSDGGLYESAEAAIAHGRALAAAGADILDVGGESTRPGAAEIPAADEIARIAPVIAALADAAPVPVDTRKAAVAEAALARGAGMVNDVTALSHDPELGPLVARAGVPVCLMHIQGTPETMQQAPAYGDVLLDVYDWLADRVAAAEAQGIPRARIVVDPGIGFGKNVAHNLALVRNLALFHGLGCPVMLGASRKRFIGTIGGAEKPADRVPGSIAVALWAVAQGAQVVRVHDVAETRQALALHMALGGGNDED